MIYELKRIENNIDHIEVLENEIVLNRIGLFTTQHSRLENFEKKQKYVGLRMALAFQFLGNVIVFCCN